jgi:hypothetical protein
MDITEEDPMALTARKAINIWTLIDTAQQMLPMTDIKKEIK